MGDPVARRAFVALLVIAHTAAIATFKPATLLTLLVAPLTLLLSRQVMSGLRGAALIPLLGKSAQLQLIFSAIFAMALAI